MKFLSALLVTLFLLQGCGKDNATSSTALIQNDVEGFGNNDQQSLLFIESLSREKLNEMGMSFERTNGARPGQVYLNFRSCIHRTTNRDYERNLRRLKHGLEEKFGARLNDMQYKTLYISGSGRIRADLMYKYLIDALEILVYRDPNALCTYYGSVVVYGGYESRSL